MVKCPYINIMELPTLPCGRKPIRLKNIQSLNIMKLNEAFKDDLPFSSASQITSMSSPSGDVYEYLPRATYKFNDNMRFTNFWFQ
jgi:hypothetical protein